MNVVDELSNELDDLDVMSTVSVNDRILDEPDTSIEDGEVIDEPNVLGVQAIETPPPLGAQVYQRVRDGVNPNMSPAQSPRPIARLPAPHPLRHQPVRPPPALLLTRPPRDAVRAPGVMRGQYQAHPYHAARVQVRQPVRGAPGVIRGQYQARPYHAACVHVRQPVRGAFRGQNRGRGRENWALHGPRGGHVHLNDPTQHRCIHGRIAALCRGCNQVRRRLQRVHDRSEIDNATYTLVRHGIQRRNDF